MLPRQNLRYLGKLIVCNPLLLIILLIGEYRDKNKQRKLLFLLSKNSYYPLNQHDISDRHRIKS